MTERKKRWTRRVAAGVAFLALASGCDAGTRTPTNDAPSSANPAITGDSQFGQGPSEAPSLSPSPTTPSEAKPKTIAKAIRDYYSKEGPYTGNLIGNLDISMNPTEQDDLTLTVCGKYTYYAPFNKQQPKGADARTATLTKKNGGFSVENMGGAGSCKNDTTEPFIRDLEKRQVFTTDEQDEIKEQIKQAYTEKWNDDYEIKQFTDVDLTPNMNGFGAACIKIKYQGLREGDTRYRVVFEKTKDSEGPVTIFVLEEKPAGCELTL